MLSSNIYLTGPGDTFTWLRWGQHEKLKEIGSDEWATRDKGSLKLNIVPGHIDEESDDILHSGFVKCLAWENTTGNLYISHVVPIRYPGELRVCASPQGPSLQNIDIK